MNNVSRGTLDRLGQFEALLLVWNRSINLIGCDESAVWQRHFEDSLQLIPHCQGAKSIADFGSGAGFPGMVLAMAGLPMTLIESDRRKCAFLREVASATQTTVEIIADRIESVERSFELVVSRATAPLDKLCAWAYPKLEKNGRCLFPKGRNYDMEIIQAREKWCFELQTMPSVTDPDAALLILSELRPQ